MTSKERKTAYRKKYYWANKGRELARNLGYAKQRRDLIRSFKEVPCADCGIEYPYYVMDFDHCRGQKTFTIGERRNGSSSDNILNEIAKCDVVCANCHREREHQKRVKEGICD